GASRPHESVRVRREHHSSEKAELPQVRLRAELSGVLRGGRWGRGCYRAGGADAAGCERDGGFTFSGRCGGAQRAGCDERAELERVSHGSIESLGLHFRFLARSEQRDRKSVV